MHCSLERAGLLQLRAQQVQLSLSDLALGKKGQPFVGLAQFVELAQSRLHAKKLFCLDASSTIHVQ
jgi:hypothetical protein